MATRKTVFIKIPRNRDGFIDPTSIRWSEDKEQKLWRVLSKSKKNDLNWNALSEQFAVPISFLQQQAYWLYESELEQLRNELQRGQTAGTSSEEPLPPKSEPKSETKSETKSIHTANELSASTKSFNVFEPRQLKHVAKYENLNFQATDPNATLKEVDFDAEEEYDPDELDDDSDSDSSSSIANLNQNSVFLHRSRILTKPLPTFDDSDEDDDEALGKDDEVPINNFQNVTLNDATEKPKQTTKSSLSNISSFSVSKSALEEALLDNSRI